MSCGKDNYEAPSAQLTGRITYEGKPVGVRGSNNSVKLQLWQSNYPLKTPIDLYVSQDGSFSAQLFDGEYQIITVPGNGPWEHKADTIVTQVNGNSSIDFPVSLFYELSDIEYSLEGTMLKVSLQTQQIDETKEIEGITLLVNNTQFVDLSYNKKQNSEITQQNGKTVISMDIGAEVEKYPILFARVALKINGITEAIYDPTVYQVQ